MSKNQTMEQRILGKINKLDNGCWEWKGARYKKQSGDYGQIRIGDRKSGHLYRAHNISYQIFKEPIPVGLELDHLCHNTLCVNPDHLEPVTHLENCHRRKDSGLLYCKHGHKYTPETTHINVRGIRECRICRRLNERTRVEKLKDTTGGLNILKIV